MLKFSPFQAPARYVWKDPDTDHEYVASNKTDLVAHIRNYRAQNDLSEIDYLDMAVDDYLCRLPENIAKCEECKLNRGFFEYLSGGINLLKNVFYGEKNMVDQREAERRASICIECPNNIFPNRSDFVVWSDRLAQASTSGRTTSKDNKLGNCEACTCCLKAKIWSKPPYTLTKEQIDKMPLFCWQLENYKEST